MRSLCQNPNSQPKATSTIVTRCQQHKKFSNFLLTHRLGGSIQIRDGLLDRRSHENWLRERYYVALRDDCPEIKDHDLNLSSQKAVFGSMFERKCIDSISRYSSSTHVNSLPCHWLLVAELKSAPCVFIEMLE